MSPAPQLTPKWEDDPQQRAASVAAKRLPALGREQRKALTRERIERRVGRNHFSIQHKLLSHILCLSAVDTQLADIRKAKKRKLVFNANLAS